MRTNIIVTVKNDLHKIEKHIYLKVYSSLDKETVRSILQTSPYKRIGIPKHIRGSRAKSGVYFGFKNAPSMTLEEAVKYLNETKFTEDVRLKKVVPRIVEKHVETHRLPSGIRITKVKHFWDKTFITFGSDVSYFELSEFWSPKLDGYERVRNPKYPHTWFTHGTYHFKEEEVSKHNFRYIITHETTVYDIEEYTTTVELK